MSIFGCRRVTLHGLGRSPADRRFKWQLEDVRFQSGCMRLLDNLIPYDFWLRYLHEFDSSSILVFT